MKTISILCSFIIFGACSTNPHVKACRDACDRRVNADKAAANNCQKMCDKYNK